MLREFPDDVYLSVATDTEAHEEEMYSVRLKKPIVINGIEKSDAEHLPARLANELFTKQEINNILK
ncbi:hypothetical protein D515_04696 [Grimontia indica]|uniref:Uncharacterized protein n=1 Tax=Grimontia indica TaxID=1056512 RepID=R1I8Q4_9GAMM|nr:hypothetical protein D515_04696 [Grimontia indica]